MSIEETIVEDLSSLNVPVFQIGSWTLDELPETFIVFDVVRSVDIKFYNDRPFLTEHQLEISVFSSDPESLETIRSQISIILLDKDYTRDGKGYGGELEEKTGRYPWFLTFYKLEKERGV